MDSTPPEDAFDPSHENPHLSWLSSAAVVGTVVGGVVAVLGALWGAEDSGGSGVVGWGPVAAVVTGLALVAWGGVAALLLAACRALLWRGRR